MMKFTSIDSVAEFVEKKGITFIDLRYTDLIGKWHHITVPANPFPYWIFTNGAGFDSASVSGFERVEKGDLVLKPDLDSSFVDSFHSEDRYLCFFANIMLSSGGYSKDPRSVLYRAERYMREEGIADEFFILPELEFYVFKSVFFEAQSTRTSFELFTYRYDNSPIKGGYELVPPEDADLELRSEIMKALMELGVEVKYHHQEGGVYGQNELELFFAPALKTADAIMLAKYVVRMVSIRKGMVATFMPKPVYNAHGSGLHMHQYLVKGGRNIFWSENSEHHLSELALHFMGGILEHLPSLMAFTNPSTNSYKRLNPTFEAPSKACFGFGNRTATVRVPLYDDNPNSKRFELRTPDGTINPYLAIAAMLMAGIDGIKKKIDPIKAGYGPVEESVGNLSCLKLLPVSLTDAINSLVSDSDYLLAGGVFSRELIESWCSLKRKEIEIVSSYPHPIEFEMYFSI